MQYRVLCATNVHVNRQPAPCDFWVPRKIGKFGGSVIRWIGDSVDLILWLTGSLTF